MKIPPAFSPIARNITQPELGTRLERQFSNLNNALAELEMPDLLPDGTFIRGNIAGRVVKVVFSESNVDVPVSHGAGRVLPNYIVIGRRYLGTDGSVVDPAGWVDIRDGMGSSGENVTYLRATFGPPVSKIVARVFLYGSSQPSRRKP